MGNLTYVDKLLQRGAAYVALAEVEVLDVSLQLPECGRATGKARPQVVR